MKKIIILMLILVLPCFYALDYYTGQNNTLTGSCFNDKFGYCPNGTECNITILYPDNSIFIKEEPVVVNKTIISYNMPLTNVSGTYWANVYCVYNGNASSSNFLVYIFDPKTSLGKCQHDTEFMLMIAAYMIISLIIFYLGARFKMWYLVMFSGIGVIWIAVTVGACSSVMGAIFFAIGLCVSIASLYYVKY